MHIYGSTQSSKTQSSSCNQRKYNCVCVCRQGLRIWSLFSPFLSRKSYLNHSSVKNTFCVFHLICRYFYQLLQHLLLISSD